MPSCFFRCSAALTIACGNNTFQPKINQIYAGACLQCPEFSVSQPASIALSKCQCMEGYYNDAEDAEHVHCEPCPVGSECEEEGNTLEQLPLLPGYWRTSDFSPNLMRCPDASSLSTTACANANGTLCKPWTSGPYCRLCNVTDGSRYYNSGDSACVPCEGSAAVVPSIFAGVVVFVLLLIGWWRWAKPYRCIPAAIRSRIYRAVRQAAMRMRAPLKQVGTRAPPPAHRIPAPRLNTLPPPPHHGRWSPSTRSRRVSRRSLES